MQNYESQRDLQAQITTNIENLQQFYGLNSVDSLKHLVEIILDPKRAEMLFKQRNITVSSIFTIKNDPTQINQDLIKLFAEKYTYERLVQKFPKPKGQNNRMLASIMEKKLAVQSIGSHQTRKNIWLLVSGARFNMNHHKGLYQNLLAYNDYPEYFMRSIRQDITRTVPKSQTSQQQLKALSNVLIAFSRRNPFVGYCQGLNFVANFLLIMQFTQEQAFWLLSSIIETVIPVDYYTNMIGVVCDQQVFLAVLGKKYPRITHKFDQVGLDPSVLSIQWFVCLFTSSLPFYLIKVVWDRLLVQGPRAFLKAGLIIMGHFQQQILKVAQFHEIIMLLEKGTKNMSMLESEFNQKFEDVFISRQGLVLARTLYRQYHLKDKLSQKVGTKKKELPVLECNSKWPICVVSLQKNRSTREEQQVWIYRQGRPPKMDPQYLIKLNTNLNIKSPQKSDKNGLKKTTTPAYKKYPIQHAKLSTIKQQRQSIFDRQSHIDDSKRSTIFDQLPQHKQLIIGRMQHICGAEYRKRQVKQSQQSENSKVSKYRKSLIITEQNTNDNLKNENLRKMMQMNKRQEQQELSEEERMQRSQTIKFFSKFLNDNTELSNIIIPSSKVYQPFS